VIYLESAENQPKIRQKKIRRAENPPKNWASRLQMLKNSAEGSICQGSQKVFLPGQWKKTVKTGKNWQKLEHTKLYRNTPITRMHGS